MVQHHKYSITEINDMYPYERDIFVLMIQQHIKEIEEARTKNG